MKLLFHLLLMVLLTLVTQIGGLIYLICWLIVRKKKRLRSLKHWALFLGLYSLFTGWIVPELAPLFGRERIKESKYLRAHNDFYKWANRNYVRPKLNAVLEKIAHELDRQQKGIQVVYLDANFPFFDGFPLLPHLSHNDGKKIDLCLIYESAQAQPINLKPSVSGYGIFVEPKPTEHNQTEFCKQQGYWQYDYPKYLTFGRLEENLIFSRNATRKLTLSILNQPAVQKVFVEPHLINRMELVNSKLRFHGCAAVRHDDHIHLQIN